MEKIEKSSSLKVSVSVITALVLSPWLVACDITSAGEGGAVSCGGCTTGVGVGSSDGGGAGGGRLSKVLKAQVQVTNLKTGDVFPRLGEQPVYTDPQTGVFTISTTWVKENQPYLITLKGNENAEYFDEGKNIKLKFGSDQEIHTLVDQFDNKSIGVSVLTEAVYRYAINNFVKNPKEIADKKVALLSKIDAAELKIITAAQIIQAQEVVTKEINRFLLDDHEITYASIMPTPVDGAAKDTKRIKQEPEGKAAIVTGAFAWAADRYYLDPTRPPALDFVNTFARDLTDGKIDNWALDGEAAAKAEDFSKPTYNAMNLPISLLVGANYIEYGYSPSNQKPVDAFWFWYRNDCRGSDNQENHLLLTSKGNIELSRLQWNSANAQNEVSFQGCTQTPGLNPKSDDAFNQRLEIKNVKEIFGAEGVAPVFYVKNTGDVYSWGAKDCGKLGDGASFSANDVESYPKKLNDKLQNMTSWATGRKFILARDNEGKAFSWGGNAYGELGLGSNPEASIFNGSCKYEDAAVAEAAATSKPQEIKDMGKVIQVFAHSFSDRAFALNEKGEIYNWGQSCGTQPVEPQFRNSPIPKRVDGLPPVRSFAANQWGCFALTSTGELFGWGFYNKNKDGATIPTWFGDGGADAHETPTPLSDPRLKGIRAIANDERFFFALDNEGRVWRWGNLKDANTGEIKLSLPKPELIDQDPDGKPVRFRHIKSGSSIRLYTKDGRIFTQAYWNKAPSYLSQLPQQ
jgi:alpha-tubulin suppressor-like RCC1 family protein